MEVNKMNKVINTIQKANENNSSNNNEPKAERIVAGVKWYNPVIGYGFLTPEDHSADVMVHFSHLDAVNCPYIKPGDQIICEAISTKLGRQVSRIIEIKFESSEPRSHSTFSYEHSVPFDPETLEEMEGTVKWFKVDKGYGFICPQDQGREIFFHVSVLRAAGYGCLTPGMRVSVKFSSSERGREARILTVLETFNDFSCTCKRPAAPAGRFSGLRGRSATVDFTSYTWSSGCPLSDPRKRRP